MAPQTPVGEPTTAVAGDTWLWTTSYGDYPASEGWTLAYTFRGPRSLDTEPGEVVHDGTTVTVNIPGSRTADLEPGTYRWVLVAVGSGSHANEVHSTPERVMTVTRNLRLAADGEALSWEERTLPIVEAALDRKLTDDMASYMIDGRQVVTIPTNELKLIRKELKRDIARQRGIAWQVHEVVLP